MTISIAFYIFFVHAAPALTAVGNEERVHELAKLSPLPKIHYFAMMQPNYLSDHGSQLLYEIARITHSMGLSGEWATNLQTDNALYTCARVNKTNPKIPASLSISYSPWHRRFEKNLPVTDFGESCVEEIRVFEDRMRTIRQWIAESNAKYGADVRVSMVKLDCERFVEKAGDNRWNEAFREKLDIIHRKAQEIFPEAKIQWYGRGMWRPDGFTWTKTPYFTGQEIKSPLSCSLYMLPEIDGVRETYKRTCELADSLAIKNVTPYVALGCGYRRGVIKKLRWLDNWDYDVVYSYLIGAELNIPWYSRRPDTYADYDRAEYIILYPPPFYDKTPVWLKHFAAYVNGASGVQYTTELTNQ